MRKLFISIIVVLLSLAVAAPASAQAFKVAVVDLQTALNEVEEGKRAKKSLETQIESTRLRLEAEGAELQQMREELQAQAVMLSEAAIREKESAFNTRAVNFQQATMEAQQTIALLEQELTGEILLKLSETAAAVGKEKGYTLVLEKTAVIYSLDAMDITDEVVARHNAGD
jgi:outer membrane protein